MEVTLALLCDAANSSAHDRLNLLGVFDTVAGGSFPFQHPLMHIVLRMSLDEQDLGRRRDVSILMCNQEGESVGELNGEMFIPTSHSMNEPRQAHLILELPNMPFPWPGLYQYHVLFDGEEKTKIPLRVIDLAADVEEQVA